MDGALCYVLVMYTEFALIRKIKYGVYSVVLTSVGCQDKLDEVLTLAKEALLLGGEFVNGRGAKSGTLDAYWAVPTVQFVPYVKPKITE
jgi:hypothetical protein